MNITSRLLLGILVSASITMSAQQPDAGADRQRLVSEVKAYKHEFLAKELKMSREQQREFFAAYDAMDNELIQIGEETRELERRYSDDAQASEAEVAAAAAAVYGQKLKEGKVEMEYFDKFSKILSPQQLLRLRGAEKKFTQTLVRHHRRMKPAEPRNRTDRHGRAVDSNQ